MRAATTMVGHKVLLLLSLLQFITGHVSSGQSIVESWPQDMLVINSGEGQINFTFNLHAEYLITSVKALLIDQNVISPIYQASETNRSIQPGFKYDFEIVDDIKHHLRIKEMRTGLVGDYIASVTDKQLREESRQFKVATADPAVCSVTQHVMEGEVVQIDCTVRLTGTGDHSWANLTNMRWYNQRGMEVTGHLITFNASQILVYRHSFIATVDHNNDAYTCSVTSWFDDNYSDGCTSFVKVDANNFTRTACTHTRANLEQGTINILDCSALYDGPVPPILKWFDSARKLLPGEYADNLAFKDASNPWSQRSHVAITPDESTSFSCVAYFGHGQPETCTVQPTLLREHRCYGEYFTSVLCPAPSVTHVVGASYGVAPCGGANSTSCCPQEGDCQVPVSTHNLRYFNTITESCDGRQRCDNLLAEWDYLPQCEKNSDYVEISYICRADT